MILKLSNLLDYLLYQTDKPAVLLTQELNHIEDYVALEQMRFSETLEVTLNTQISNPDVVIPPMVLLPFVENSLKHGAIIDGTLRINLQLNADSHKIHFRIKNSKKDIGHQRTGIGLENIKKLLKLLFLERYDFLIED